VQEVSLRTVKKPVKRQSWEQNQCWERNGCGCAQEKMRAANIVA
jgi:hypothetical protein